MTPKEQFLNAVGAAVKQYREAMQDHADGQSMALIGVLLRPDAPDHEKTKVLFTHHGSGDAMVALGQIWMKIFEADPDADGKISKENVHKALREVDPGAKEIEL